MRRTTKKQKQTTKANSLKFDWLQEHRHLKKLEEVQTDRRKSVLKSPCWKTPWSLCVNSGLDASPLYFASQSYSKELESLLLRLYNDACAEEALVGAKKPKERPAKADDTEDDNNNNTGPSDEAAPLSLARELEELVKLEQAHRVALLTQISSEREQVTMALA